MNEPHQNDHGNLDLSAYDTAEPLPPIGSDEEALRKIGRRTTPMGRAAFGLLALAIGGIGAFAFMNFRSQADQEAKLQAINAMDDASQVPVALRNLLPELTDVNLRHRVLMNLGAMRDEASVPLAIQALDEPGIVRRAAAWALGRIGLPAAAPAKDKLLAVLPDTDEKDRQQVVWTLALLRENRASDAILESFQRGQLQAMDDFDPRVIVEVLGPAKLASNELITHDAEPVRRLTAVALSEAASPEVVEPLTRLLRAEMARPEPSTEIVRAVVAGLGRTGEPAAARPLFELLTAQPNMMTTVVDALRKSASASSLAALLREAQDVAVRRELVKLLVETRDPRAADALASALSSDDPETKRVAAVGLASLGDGRAAPVLVELVRSTDTSTADKAADALRHVAKDIGVPELAKMLSDMPYRKATILSALGKSGDAAAVRVIEGELKGDDAPAAARALAELGDEAGFRKVVAMIPRPRNTDMGATNAADRSLTNEDLLRTRRAAIAAAGIFQKPEAIPSLVTVVEDPKDDYELRGLAAQSIGLAATPEQMREVIAKIQSDAVPQQSRDYYVRALWQRPSPELADSLLQIVASAAPTSVRRAAAIALGYAADESHAARLSTLLDAETTRSEVALAIALGAGGEEAAKKLVTVLESNRDARDVLSDYFSNDDAGYFAIVTQNMLESGQIWRRMKNAKVLHAGSGKMTYGFVRAALIAALQSGWDGPGGASARDIREFFFAALVGPDAEKRRQAAEMLGLLGERGLLLRARDQGGPGSDEARAVLTDLNRPAAS